MRIAGALVGALLLTGCSLATPVPAPSPSSAESALAKSEFTIVTPADRTLFPEWSATDLDGYAWNTSSLGARLTVVNFWASWCLPCETEWPELQSAAADHRSVNFIGIDTMDEMPAARQFIKDHPSDYRQLVDGTAHILQSLDGMPHSALPTTIILDGTRRIAAWKAGPTSAAQLRRALARIT